MRITFLRVIALVAGMSALTALLPGRPTAPLPEPITSPIGVLVTDHVVVELAGTPAEAGLDAGQLEHLFDNWYKLFVQTGESVEGVQLALERRAGVLGVYPDYIVTVPRPTFIEADSLGWQTRTTPNDPLFGLQWHMSDIQAEAAWNATEGQGVVVAVVDSGVASDGPDGFCRPLHSEFNAITNQAGAGRAYDDDGHGTHVAGTIAQCTRNNTGVAGLAYEARVMAVKVLDSTGSGSYADVAQGINWAADNGADVINLSLGSSCSTAWPTCSTSVVNAALANAAAADVVVVAAAGNSSLGTVGFPANHPDAMAIMATETRRLRAYYSNYGSALSMAAPGGDTTANRNGDAYVDGVLQETVLPSWGYFFYQGTSMASPHVAGAATLLRACVPEASRSDVRNALEQSALDLGSSGFDNVFGNGYLQVYDALAELATAFGRDVDNGCALTGTPVDCYSLTINVNGQGAVNPSPASNCAGGKYQDGTQVTLTAQPDSGWTFDQWSGAASGSNPTTSVNMTRNRNVTATFESVAPPPPPPSTADEIHLSTLANASAGGLSFRDEDIVAYSEQNGWSLLFDGSDVGLNRSDINAFAWLPDGTLLLSVDKPVSGLPGLGGTVDDGDIVRFTPSSLGNSTAGSYEMYFDGSDVGVSARAEDIDALAVLPNGDLLISTLGALKVSGLTAADEDIARFSPASLGNNTAGSWSLHLDVSDISSGIKDVFSLSAGSNGVYALTANRNFSAGSVSVRPLDIFGCTPTSFGSNTTCGSPQLLLNGTAAGLTSATIDGVAIITP